MRWLALFVVMLATPLGAQDVRLPALYDVTDVAADDVLNVRAGPGASLPIVNELGPEAAGVEVVAFNDDRSWGMINLAEAPGWVSMRFMTRQPGQDGGDRLPVPLYCGGTEPFWWLEITQTDVTFTDPGSDEPPLTMLREPVGPNLASPRGALVAGDITGFVSRERCSDGMSDRAYGWRVDFFRTGNGGSFPFSGCCSLQF